MSRFPAGIGTHFVILLFSGLLFSQEAFSQKGSYPKGYFALPVYPGKPNTLSGALGDLRSNHFHAGIDVRTQQKEGLPVTAAADGYISRIAVHRSGYGKVLYISHPNGMTTVYAHLKEFNKEIGDYVRQEQYRNQSFEVGLTPDAGRFQVKKGQLVAISGNTGSSEGPHLHFEIRDSRDNCLNPLFFNFPEIKDATPPRFVSIALAPLNIDSRVNGRIDRQVFMPASQKSGPEVFIKDTIRASGSLGLELQAFDRMDGAGFNYGLNCIEVRLDGQEIFAFNMEKFPVDVARDYNYLINYKARVDDGERYYKCYNPAGNTLNIYKTDENRGKLIINDTLVHSLAIRIFDSFENWSELKFVIKGETPGPATEVQARKSASPALHTEVSGEMLKVKSPERAGALFSQGRSYPWAPAYTEGDHYVFLSDLSSLLPDSVAFGATGRKLYFSDKITPGRTQVYEGREATVKFGEKSVFDTLYLQVYRIGNTLQINDFTDPLRGSIEVSYRPVVENELRGKTHIYRLVKGRDIFIGGEWDESGGIKFSTRELGTFYPRIDSVPPVARILESSPNRIRARIDDDLSGISSFRARVNGEWVLMNYEYKSNYIWSEKADESVPFEGELELEVTDRAGNIKTVKAKIAEPVRSRSRTRR